MAVTPPDPVGTPYQGAAVKLITINGNGNGEHDVSAHRADCQDVAKAIKGHEWFEDEVECKRALWLDYNSDFLAEGSGAWAIHFFPCTRGLPDGGRFNTNKDEEGSEQVHP